MILVKNYDVYSDLIKQELLSTLKTLYVISFVNLKIE